MAEQCLRIAEALSVIHQDQEEKNPTRADEDGEQLYGRHGDIKPDNILWFGEHIECKNAGTLVLADFGIAKAHRSMTKSLSDPEKAKNSPTYKSPEFESNGHLKIGRKSDIWGLACTWIEFITWYLKGWQAVDVEFPNRRDETDPKDENISRDTYFSIVNGEAIVKPGVIDWIEELHQDNNCSAFIHEFLSFIQEKMLLVNPSDRATAYEVSQQMEKFFERTRNDSAYSNFSSK
ncbi:kinase-like protein [Acephala macrosclerotiorum]|nr:kinase-like protein [Acephala macrosclerotiorum]